ncbi:MAG TPA: TonB-dependent receptor, partial [Ideonella sp.]|nr:TonB-dependent receptor [Ideonella sp.]
ATAACGLLASGGAQAQAAAPPEPAASAPRTERVVVIGTRSAERPFDVAASVDVVDGATVREQQVRVNLSETLSRVPGLVVQNRQNLAQDLQVSSRGFGARSTFGVRGVRLIQDGIPITMPDGQGQTASFDLDGAEAIEVLRGPFAALYGNASGGVVHLITEAAPQQPSAELSASAGSFDSWRTGLRVGGRSGDIGLTANVSRYQTDGYREHSAARRDLANAKLRWDIDGASSLTVVANGLDQPDTQDPLGLTQEQLDTDRRQAGANAEAFNTRKSIRHEQAGLVYRRQFGGGGKLEASGYGGTRQVTQFLGLPLVAQGPTSSGGVVDLDREFAGSALQWQQAGELQGRRYTLTAGLAYDRMREHRRGFVSDTGVQGALRRDEIDTVSSFDQYLIATWQLAERWKLQGGLRHSEVRFDSADRYIAGPNPDDSGAARYASTSPVLGLLFQLTPEINLFAAYGRGFETPTFAELAYRPGGETGLNFDLQAATSRNAELGVKAQLASGLKASATLFRADTRNDVVSAGASGGRTVYSNAGRTRRDGAELALDAALAAGWSAYAAYTYTRADFRELVTAAGADLSGSRIPGVPRQTLFAELAWRHAASGFSSAAELRAASRIQANDANTASAPGYATLGWRGGFEQRTADGWRFSEFLRVDNLLDKAYVGSVIVNETNQRFFEPAPGRSWTLGATAARSF